VLFQALFRRHGIETVIADPTAFEARAGRLWCNGETVDLVYNRLTDFAFEEPRMPRCAPLARRSGADHPASARACPVCRQTQPDLLTDPEWLGAAGIAPATIDVLMRGIARTRLVERTHAESLWAERKRLFFKPAGGFGGKAVYRGDKLTRRVWEDILAVTTWCRSWCARRKTGAGRAETSALKYDVRNFVYDGKVQLLAARLYQGQVTNFAPRRRFCAGFLPTTGSSRMKDMTIGVLARAAGVSIETIRYYQRRDCSPPRASRRVACAAMTQTHSRTCASSSAPATRLQPARDWRPARTRAGACAETRVLAEARLADIETRLRDLQACGARWRV